MRRGGIGEAVAATAVGRIPRHPRRLRAIDRFIPHGDDASLLRLAGLDAASIEREVRRLSPE